MKTMFEIVFAVVISSILFFSACAARVQVTDNFPADDDLRDNGLAESDLNDLWTYAGKVMDHISSESDVIGHNLTCLFGFWGQGKKKTTEKQCHGSCTTDIYWFGVIFGCGEQFVPDGCRRLQASTSCACNQPLCNDGTIPKIFRRFTDARVTFGVSTD